MDKQTCRERLKEMNCLVVIPTYNNEGTVLDVVRDVMEYAPELLVVNDGSTDSTSSLLHGVEGIRLLEYSRNRGKGGALKLAIKYAVRHGFSYMLTLDADGQHYADDIPVFVEAAMQEPDTLFVGARNLKAKNMPGANSFANRFSNFWYMVDTGKRMSDTQSGYRLYPLEKLGKMHFLTGRYEFEVEIIVRAAWNRIPVKNIPIRVWYAPKEERVSHFKPLRDFGRISLLNTGLFLWAILIHYPWIGISYFTKGDVEELKHIIASTRNKPGKMAASMGWGVFCGIIPAWLPDLPGRGFRLRAETQQADCYGLLHHRHPASHSRDNYHQLPHRRLGDRKRMPAEPERREHHNGLHTQGSEVLGMGR